MEHEPRLTIRQRYEPTGNRYQVIKHGAAIGSHHSKEAAAIAIRDAGGRVAASWTRTDFGNGDGPMHADFIATLLGEEIGRVMRLPHGPQRDRWSWSMYAHKKIDRFRMQCQGVEDSKQEAARMVEWVYTQCVEDKPDFIP